MSVLNAGFELGVRGATIATADKGDGDAWDAVTLGAGAAAVYDDAHAALGAQAAKLSTGGTSTTAYLSWVARLGTVTNHYGRIYLYLTANPAATLNLVRFMTGGTVAGGVSIQTAGKLQLQRTAGAIAATGGVSVSLNQWVRIEWHLVHDAAAGSVEAKLFNTAGSSSASETVTASAQNTNASADALRVGATVNGANVGPFWVDQIQAGAAAYPGPAPAGLPSRMLLGVG